MSEWEMPEGRRVEGSLDKLVGIADGGAGWLVFNNPDRRNAVSKEMWEAIPVILQAFEDDPDVKIVILTGAGGKAFVSDPCYIIGGAGQGITKSLYRPDHR